LRTVAHDIQHRASDLLRPAVADAANCFRDDDKEDMASVRGFCCCAETSSNQDPLEIAFVPGPVMIRIQQPALMPIRASSTE
jgi:hypothetical protein